MSALNIKDPKVAEKARKLAKATGKTITAAVSDSLDESLRMAGRQTSAENEERERQVDEIVKRFKAKIPPDAPSPWDVLDDMYDEYGLPK